MNCTMTSSTIYVAKTKALNICAVTTQLICAFVFAYVKSNFSHDADQLIIFIFSYFFYFYMFYY